MQDKWQPQPQPDDPVRPALGDAEAGRTRSRPANEVFYAPFIGKTVTNSYGHLRLPLRRRRSRPTTRCGSRAWASRGTRAATARRSCALNGGHLLRPRPGPEPRLLALHERQPRPERRSAPASSTASASRRRPTRTCSRPRPVRARPTTRTCSSSTRTSRTRAPGRPRPRVEREVAPDLARPRPVQLRQGRAHHALPRAERHRLRLPVGHGPRPRTNGIACGTPAAAASRASSRRPRAATTGITFGLTKRWSNNYQFQVNYTLSWDKSDDDNERDPFTYRYIRVRQPRRRVRLLGPRPAPPAERASLLWLAPGKVERQPALLVPLGAAAVAQRDRRRCRSRLRPDLGPHPRRRHDRRAQHRPQGQRVLVARPAPLARVRGSASACSIEPIFEVFNLFNSKNLLVARRPPTWSSTSTARSRAASATRARCSSERG